MGRAAGVAVAVAAGALLAACGGGDDASREAAPTSTITSMPGDVAAGEAISVDWTTRTIEPAEVDGWTLEPCEGDAPLVCLSRGGGEATGAVELSEFALSSFTALEDKRGLDALEALADDAVTALAADRKEGCGVDYAVEADETVPQQVLGTDGLRYGWTATVDGEVVERNVSYAAIVGPTVYLLVAGALEPDGCMERLSEFRVDDLDDARPVLDRIAAGSQPPAR